MSRKTEILDALIDIFKTKGIQSDFTISELARKVDIGKSTIYEYFDTKDEILAEAFYRIFEKAITSIRERQVDSELNFEQALKDELRFVFNLASSSSFMFELLTPDFHDNVPNTLKGNFANEMKLTAKHYETTFRNIVVKGIEEGVLQDDNLPIKGMLFGSLVSGSITRMTNFNNMEIGEFDMEQYIDAIYQTAIKLFN